MIDDLDKFKEQAKITEGLFDRIFGGNKSQPAVAQPTSDFYQAPNGTYVFGGKSTTKSLNKDAINNLITGDFDLRNSALNFMLAPGTEFHAQQMRINLKKEVITFFNGKWISGPYYGETFEGIFNGSSFQGDFEGPYTNYEARPESFMGGTFSDTTGDGLLGLPNTVSLARIGQRKFNLITIPVDHYFQFKTINGITAYIKIIKRLDGIDSGFSVEVFDGFKINTPPYSVDIPWESFRSDFMKSDVKRIYSINKNSKNIFGLIQIPVSDAIKEMYISTSLVPTFFPAPTQAPAPSPVATAPAQSSQPGMTSAAIAQSFMLPESIRGSVRKIINDSF